MPSPGSVTKRMTVCADDLQFSPANQCEGDVSGIRIAGRTGPPIKGWYGMHLSNALLNELEGRLRPGIDSSCVDSCVGSTAEDGGLSEPKLIKPLRTLDVWFPT
jgi:hypothetical protein